MEEKKLEVVLKGSIDTNSAGVQDIRIDVSDLVNFFVKKEEKKNDNGGSSEIIASGEEAEKLTSETLENSKKSEESENFLIDYSKFSYSGDLKTEPYREIIAFQDGKVYLSYEGFSYFFMMSLAGIFIFRMFIKFCIFAFNLGFNYFVIGKK